jgi:nucleoside-diphosphate-sugar epimerase
VGRHLVERLRADGFEVRAHVRRLPTPSPWSVQPEQIATGDLNDPAAVTAMVQDVGAVIHCAARLRADHIEHFRRDNAEVTDGLAKAAQAADVTRFVHLSSIAVYGLKEQRNTTEDAPMAPGTDGYAITKVEAESRLVGYPSLQTVVLRPGFVWGGPYDERFMGTIRPMVQRRRFVYPGACRTPLPFSHVDNLADAVRLALQTSDGVGHAFNITDDLRVSLRDFVTALAIKLKVRPPRWTVPQSLASGGLGAMHALGQWLGGGRSIGFRPDAIRLLNTECTFSNEAARNVLQFAPSAREHLAGRKSIDSPS